MKLFYRKYGEGKPLFILHGLFGMSDNWMTLAKQFSENGFSAYAIDLRNHGRSPHSTEFNYRLMADDIAELIKDLGEKSVPVIGHSMGGKAAMFLALHHPGLCEKIVVADIAPRYYPQHNESVVAALDHLDLNLISSRKEAEEQLRASLHDEGTVQFLLKNLYWVEGTGDEVPGTEELSGHGQEKKLAWRFNFPVIEKNIEEVGAALPEKFVFNKPVLFVKGERSGYITASDEVLIRRHFPSAIIKTIPGVGHWVHAENPKAFLEIVLEFLQK